MLKGEKTFEDFKVLVRRAGLTLTDAQLAEIYGAWGHVEGMLARIRAPMLPREAEPSHTFKPEYF